MDKNEIKNKFESVHLPINCYLWRFRGLLLSFYGYTLTPQSSSCVISKELLSCPLCPPKEKSPMTVLYAEEKIYSLRLDLLPKKYPRVLSTK